MGFVWVLLAAFGAAFLAVPPLILDPRVGPPRAVYFLLWFAFVVAAGRLIVLRYFATCAVVLEGGLYLPAFRPLHFVRLASRAVLYQDLKAAVLDDSPLRSGTHLFVTVKGPKRCPKAFFPPAKRLAEEIKARAPHVEVSIVDRKGRTRRYAPAVVKRPRRKEPNGGRADAK